MEAELVSTFQRNELTGRCRTGRSGDFGELAVGGGAAPQLWMGPTRGAMPGARLWSLRTLCAQAAEL